MSDHIELLVLTAGLLTVLFGGWTMIMVAPIPGVVMTALGVGVVFTSNLIALRPKEK